MAVLISSCPLFCGADEIGHRAQHLQTDGHSQHEDSPDRCPDTNDNCVCRGAVQLGDARVHSPHLELSTPLFFPFAPEPRASLQLHHLTWEGAPTGLAGWGDSLAIRAFLQNFRF